MVAGGEHVEDRDRAGLRELLENRLGPGPHADGIEVAREHEHRVAQRLTARELQLVGAQDQRVAAQLDDAHLEGHPRPRRWLLEHQPHAALVERLRAARRRLQLERPLDQRAQFGAVQLSTCEEMPGHRRTGQITSTPPCAGTGFQYWLLKLDGVSGGLGPSLATLLRQQVAGLPARCRVVSGAGPGSSRRALIPDRRS